MFDGLVLSWAEVVGGGLALARQPTILVLASCAWGKLDLLRPSSTAAMSSTIGTLLEAGVKFRLLARTSFSAVDSPLEERLTTHLSSHRLSCISAFTRSNKVSNFLFWCSLHLAITSSWALPWAASSAETCCEHKFNSCCLTYKRLPKDPTPAQERNMNAILLPLTRAVAIPEHLYYHLRSSEGKVPLLYGLPKIHKPGIPPRPTVSFVNSPTYALSKHLGSILSSVVGNSPSHVRNSADFASFIAGQTVHPA